jgi:hypothetical protein
VHACRAAGLTVMLDLLLGAPGETRASLQRTVELTQALSPDRVGVTVGVRVYPGTRLAANRDELRAGLELHGQGAWALEFYLEPAVAPFVFTFLDELIGADERFLFFSPHRPERNYNYNANERLSAAIRAGHRGAYWDILRRYRQVGSAASAAAARCG